MRPSLKTALAESSLGGGAATPPPPPKRFSIQPKRPLLLPSPLAVPAELLPDLAATSATFAAAAGTADPSETASGDVIVGDKVGWPSADDAFSLPMPPGIVSSESATAAAATDAAAAISGDDEPRGASRPPRPAPRSPARPPLAGQSKPLTAAVLGESAETDRAPPTTPTGRTAPDPETNSSPPCTGTPASAAAATPTAADEASADRAAAEGLSPAPPPPPPPPSLGGLPLPETLTRPSPSAAGDCPPAPPPMRPSNAGSGSYVSGIVDPPFPCAAAATRSAAESAADGVAAAGA